LLAVALILLSLGLVNFAAEGISTSSSARSEHWVSRQLLFSISFAAVSVPCQVAFEVFIGTSSLSGGVSTAFLGGIHNAFYASIVILVIAGVLSYFRGRKSANKTSQTLKPNTPKHMICILAYLRLGN